MVKQLKKVLCLVLIISVYAASLGGIGILSAYAYSDTSGHWAQSVINKWTASGIISGDGDGTFRPDDYITRAEFVKVITSAKKYSDVGSVNYFDVRQDDWFYLSLAKAAFAGIISGYEDGTFRPNDNITREEAAVIIGRAYEISAASAARFSDSASISDWAAQYVGAMYANQIINGYSDGTFKPQMPITRAETVQIIDQTEQYSNSRTSSLTILDPNISPSNSSGGKVQGGGIHFGGGTGGGGDKPSGTSNTYTVTFDLNYEGATGAPAAQKVKKGEKATMPNDPSREGYVFMGWHSQKDKIGYFDFEKTTVSSDISIYAQWVDTTDVTDTDGDGLTDPFEYYYGTDKTKFDTDDDGLNDYFELYIVNTEPLKKDSDNDGITDNLEDADDDKLNNEEEYSLGTNAIYYDTDHDLISDYDEIHIYGTDPLNADTDGDGATDSDEIKIGSNPLTAETTFITESDFGEPTSENPVSIKVDALTDAKGAGTLEVEAVRRTDNYLASDFVAGYLGYAYDLTADGELESAKLTFSYDQSLGTIGDDFQPRIYYLNEETGEFEELPNQTVTDGQVIAETTHFSTYILLNKVEFDKIWETEIKPPEGQDGTRNSIAMVFSIDSSGSMSSNDPSGLRKEVAKDFTQKLRDDDVAAVIDFDSNAQLLTGFTSDKQVISDAIDQVNSSGGTNLGRAVSLALEQFNNYEESPSSSKMIIMLTDGNGSYNSDLTEQAKNNNVVIYTVGLGSSIDEELLKEIADGTGGKYYFASQADELESIFDNIAGETVDKTTDSNNDGISDYYTKLINDGKLCLTNTSYELTGCTDIFGEESADWDGDGLLNGEEIEIIIGSNGQPKIKMTSHPFWADYDCDGYSDYDEVKGMNTDPLKYTLPYRQEYDKLISNTSVRYYSKMIADKYTDNWFVVGVTHTFDWNKTAESEKILVDYFYDYASEDSVNANAEKIAQQAQTETVISAVNNILGITKNLKGITDTTTGISELDRKQEKVNNFKYDVFKGLPEIFKCANEKDTETALELVADTMDSFETGAGIVEDFNNTAEGYLDTTENATGVLSGILKISKNTFNLMYKDGKMVNLPVPKAFTKFSQKYTKWMGSDAFAGLNKAQLVDIAFDVADLAADSAELYATYSKLQANTEAYIEYIECIDYISQNGNGVGFVKDAAGEVAQIVLKNGNFMQEMSKMITQNSVKTFIKVGVDILAKNPYVGAIKAGIDLGISLSGITKMTAATVKSLMSDSITDSFVYMLGLCVTPEGWLYISVSSYDEAVKYLTQLSQSRIYGEDVAKDMYNIKSLSTWIADVISPLTGKMTMEEMLEEIDYNISVVYSSADNMGLKLSSKLPNFSGSGFGGGGGGAF